MAKQPRKSPSKPAQADPKRMRVKDLPYARKTLFWPASLVGAANRDVRGGGGYVVDWTLPYEREWCAGQEYKLEPAPDDAQPTPITLKQALKEIARIKGEVPEPPKTVQEQKRENAQAAPKPEQAELPTVAPRPQPKKEDGK